MNIGELIKNERGEQDPSFYMIENICLALDNDQVIYKKNGLKHSESIVVKNIIDMVLASIKEIHLNNGK